MDKLEMVDLVMTLQKKIRDEERETQEGEPSSVFKSKKKVRSMKDPEAAASNSTGGSDPAD